MKKLLGLFLSAILCLGSIGFVGCAQKSSSSGVIIDPTKEVINISLFSAGFGTQWLTDLLNDYNATLTGKYQFNRIAENTDSIDTITDQINAGIRKADIYFNDTSDFQRLMRIDGMLLDLTSVWEAKPDGTETTWPSSEGRGSAGCPFRRTEREKRGSCKGAGTGSDGGGPAAIDSSAARAEASRPSSERGVPHYGGARVPKW